MNILKESIEVAKEKIPQIEGMLNTEAEELEKRYKQEQQSFTALQQESKNIINRITVFNKDLINLLRNKSNIFYDQLANNIKKWIDEYKFSTPINIMNPLKINEHVNDNLGELTEYLCEKIEIDFSRWQQETLDPFLISRLETLKQELDNRASAFIRNVEKLAAQLADVQPSKTSATLERLFYSAEIPISYNREWVKAVLFSAMPVASTVATLTGLINPSLLIGIGLTILNPITLTVIAGTILTWVAKEEFKSAGSRIQKDIKTKASEQFSENISQSKSKQVDDFCKSIEEQLTQIKNIVEQGLAKELQGVRDQVTSALNDKRQGEEHTKRKLQELKDVLGKLEKLEDKLVIFIT